MVCREYVNSTRDALMTCPRCGGSMLGDGYREVFHCEFAEWHDYRWVTPDDEPVYCRYWWRERQFDQRGCVGFHTADDHEPDCVTCGNIGDHGMCAFFINHKCRGGLDE
jgi:hypothetical protein